MNMHYGPKEAPLVLIWSPAEVHRGRDASWVKLLRSSGDPLSAAGEAERGVFTPRASRTDVANRSLLWGDSKSGMTCWSVPVCQPGPWPPPCCRAIPSSWCPSPDHCLGSFVIISCFYNSQGVCPSHSAWVPQDGRNPGSKQAGRQFSFCLNILFMGKRPHE